MTSIRNQLKDILQNYESIASKNPLQLRLAIPSKEIWRFFIDGNRQEMGRGLGLTDIFKCPPFYNRFFFKNHLYYTIKNYVQDIEKANYEEDDGWMGSKLLGILAEKMWNIDQNEFNKFRLIDLLNMDKAWIPFERNEKGYLKALTNGFDFIFDFSKPLTVDYIENLHKLATEDVQNTEYSGQSEKKGEFRSLSIGAYGLTDENTSVTGLLEFIRKIKANSYASINSDIHLYKCFGGKQGLNINAPFLFLIEKLSSQKTQYSDEELCNLFIDFFAGNTRTKKAYVKDELAFIKKLINAKNDKDIARCIYEKICSGNWFYQESEQRNNPKSELTKRMQVLIDRYEQDIKKTTDNLCKLMIIVNFVQSCEQLHPFIDGNCRTFCTLLLNHLLMRNGFPLAILNDPNKFGLFGKNELLHEILGRIQNTLTLVKTKSLYNIKTDSLLDYLKNNHFHDELTYFENIVKAEEQARSNLIRCCCHC